MFNALRAQRVPTELHLFAEGKHGFGIRGARGLPAAEWPQLAMNWIASLPAVKK
jgi:acetyl esterase/lipase